jgi:hypothetical protein
MVIDLNGWTDGRYRVCMAHAAMALWTGWRRREDDSFSLISCDQQEEQLVRHTDQPVTNAKKVIEDGDYDQVQSDGDGGDN